jgi:hypothetical protein
MEVILESIMLFPLTTHFILKWNCCLVQIQPYMHTTSQVVHIKSIPF